MPEANYLLSVSWGYIKVCIKSDRKWMLFEWDIGSVIGSVMSSVACTTCVFCSVGGLGDSEK